MEKGEKRKTGSTKKAFFAAVVGVLIVCAAASFMLFRPHYAEKGEIYVIRDGNRTFSVISDADSPEEVLKSAGLSLENSRFELREEEDATVIEIIHAPVCTVECDGEERVAAVFGTVADALDAAGIKLCAGDAVVPPLSEKVEDGMRIIVARGGG